MTPQEAIETIKVAIAEVEWNYPMDYAVAFEVAIEALEKQKPKEIKEVKEYWVITKTTIENILADEYMFTFDGQNVVFCLHGNTVAIFNWQNLEGFYVKEEVC